MIRNVLISGSLTFGEGVVIFGHNVMRLNLINQSGKIRLESNVKSCVSESFVAARKKFGCEV